MTSSHNPLPDVGISRLHPPPDVADLIRVINARSEAVEDQCLRARQATDIAARSALAAQQSATAAKDAELAYRAIQAGVPASARVVAAATAPRARGPSA